MKIAISCALVVALAVPAAADDPQQVVLEHGGWVLDAGSPYHGREDIELVVGTGATVVLSGFAFPGRIHVTADGALSVQSPSSVHTLRVSGTGRVTAASRLQVLRLLAEDAAVIDAPALDIELPALPKEEDEWTAEQWDAWFEQRTTAPPYLIAEDEADVLFDELIGDPLDVQTLMRGRARVRTLGHVEWLGLDMRDDASFTGTSVWASGNVTGRARFEVTESASWGSIDARDQAHLHMVGTGGVATGFSIRLHDAAGALVERAGGGMYQHLGSGMLEMVDAVAPPEVGGIRELRVWMKSAEARVTLRNFGQVHALNAPVCGSPCNPWFVVFGEGEYLRVDDSLLNLEIDRVRFVELHDSVGPSVYPVSTGGGGYKAPIRGECLLNAGSVTSIGFERQCARLSVTAIAADGTPLRGATLTLLDRVTTQPAPAYDVAAGELSASRTTGTDGTAVFDLAPRGQPLTLRVQADGIDQTQDVVLLRDHEEVTVRAIR